MFKKKNSQFYTYQKSLYKKLSEIEFEVKDTDIRKKITNLIDKVYNLKDTDNPNSIALCETCIKYVNELTKEMMNPVALIIYNYVEKIDGLLNQIKYKGED